MLPCSYAGVKGTEPAPGAAGSDVKDISITPRASTSSSSQPGFWQRHLHLRQQQQQHGGKASAAQAQQQQPPPVPHGRAAQQHWREQRWQQCFPQRLMAVVWDDGSCRIIDVEGGGVVSQLALPKGGRGIPALAIAFAFLGGGDAGLLLAAVHGTAPCHLWPPSVLHMPK